MGCGRRHTALMGNASSVTTGPLAGRVVEQRLLHEILSASAEGVPAAVLVHGEAGVGRPGWCVTSRSSTGPTATRCRRPRGVVGHEVLWGTCVRFGAASVPFAPVVQALDSWALRVDPTVRSTLLEGSDELSILLPSMGMRSAEAVEVAQRSGSQAAMAQTRPVARCPFFASYRYHRGRRAAYCGALGSTTWRGRCRTAAHGPCARAGRHRLHRS